MPELSLQPEPDPPNRGRQAAVAVLLYPLAEGETGTVLTLRPIHLPRHPGQISFPGGARGPDDPDLKTTALRETAEEIGVRVPEEAVLGWLPSHHIVVSDFQVAPLVCWLPARPEVHPDPAEVQQVLFPVLERLWQTEAWETRRNRPAPLYLWEGQRIWGATAYVLHSLRRSWKTLSTGEDRRRSP